MFLNILNATDLQEIKDTSSNGMLAKVNQVLQEQIKEKLLEQNDDMSKAMLSGMKREKNEILSAAHLALAKIYAHNNDLDKLKNEIPYILHNIDDVSKK